MHAGLECRFCKAPLQHCFADLGASPIANDNLTQQDLLRMEPFYPLTAFVCSECFLVQLEVYVQPEGIFTEYAYFSSYSTTWLEHARTYVETITERLKLDAQDQRVRDLEQKNQELEDLIRDLIKKQIDEESNG